MEIFIYAFSVMYSPGPVNLMGLNAGLSGGLQRSTGFFVGVGCAMLMLFVFFGYTGEAVVSKAALPYLSLMGGLYTLYLAYQVYTAPTPGAAEGKAAAGRKLTFGNGFLIQALNPKGIMAVLPICSVMLPAAHISGFSIVIVSGLLAIAAGGAPWGYALLGALMGRGITHGGWFALFNRLMGLALVACAYFMLQPFYQLLKTWQLT